MSLRQKRLNSKERHKLSKATERFSENMRTIDLPHNFHIVNTDQIYCSLAEHCTAIVDRRPLLIDYGYMGI